MNETDTLLTNTTSESRRLSSVSHGMGSMVATVSGSFR
jgi:hypothetical protein